MKNDEFIANLARVESNGRMENPYRNELQRRNLAMYLNYMTENPPDCLLVGEAPGHLGCALTGIPFTDEYRFTEKGQIGCNPLTYFSESNIIKENRNNPNKELSATVLWTAMANNHFYPIMWNIFPFHPHDDGRPNTNRTPTPTEIAAYRHFVTDLLKMFPSIKRVYAVGRKASNGLKIGGYSLRYIRHPSHGGQRDCIAGIERAARGM
jgi:hypothetical protein